MASNNTTPTITLIKLQRTMSPTQSITTLNTGKKYDLFTGKNTIGK